MLVWRYPMSASSLPLGIQAHGRGFRFTFRNAAGQRVKSPTFRSLEAVCLAQAEYLDHSSRGRGLGSIRRVG